MTFIESNFLSATISKRFRMDQERKDAFDRARSYCDEKDKIFLKICAKEFRCAICMDSLQEPAMVQCGHIFCKACIIQSFEMAEEGQKRCPLCKAKSASRNLAKVEPLDLMIALGEAIAEAQGFSEGILDSQIEATSFTPVQGMQPAAPALPLPDQGRDGFNLPSPNEAEGRSVQKRQGKDRKSREGSTKLRTPGEEERSVQDSQAGLAHMMKFTQGLAIMRRADGRARSASTPGRNIAAPSGRSRDEGATLRGKRGREAIESEAELCLFPSSGTMDRSFVEQKVGTFALQDEESPLYEDLVESLESVEKEEDEEEIEWQVPRSARCVFCGLNAEDRTIMKKYLKKVLKLDTSADKQVLSSLNEQKFREIFGPLMGPYRAPGRPLECSSGSGESLLFPEIVGESEEQQKAYQEYLQKLGIDLTTSKPCFAHFHCLQLIPEWTDREIVATTIKESATHRCCFCAEPGATLVCREDGCTARYHLPCALLTGPKVCSINYGSTSCLCKKHARINPGTGKLEKEFQSQ